MSDLGISFNRNELPEQDSFEPIPAAWYPARIVEAEPKDSKSGNGQYINVQWEIMGAKFSGRKVFGRITTRNVNEVAEEIGRKQIRELMEATGLAVLNKTEQLIGKTCEIKVSVSPATAQYEASNDIKRYRAAGGALPTASSAPSAAAATPAATAKKPWER